jgi:hypothetical protein
MHLKSLMLGAEMIGQRLQELVRDLNRKLVASSRVFVDGFVPAQLASLLVDVISWWLEQGRPYTLRRIATYYYRMMRSILKDIPTWD